ncbi:hypothetical protein ACFFGL_10670 [Mesonia maritima]
MSTIAQQKKSEKEERISKDEMPEKAIQFFNEVLFEETNTYRFYFETDGKRKSYETKFKKNKVGYSIEFGEDGNLQDVEVTVPLKKLNAEVKKRIEKFFNEQYSGFRIEKVQLQYLHQQSKNAQETYSRASNIFQNKPDNYEIVAKVKIDGNRKHLEVLFDASGNFIKKREIAENSYDYLIF